LVRAFAAAVAVAATLVVGCSSDPDPVAGSGDFCSTAKSANGTCKEPTPCDATFAASCTSLAKVLSASTMTAAQNCLESGVCGVSSCVARAQKSSVVSAAHKQLATNYCESCAGGASDCEAGFYNKKSSRAPGLVVLPYEASVAAAVDAECTGVEGCQAKFSACAREVIAQVVGEKLDADAATCVVDTFGKDEGEGNLGPDGTPQKATCTPANCFGCCRDDRCEQGTTEAGCGVGAEACEVCSGTQKCTGGVCKEPCSPNNCPGCCDGDTCVLGTAKDKCGGNGAACKACAGSFVCSNKQCIDGSCQATCTSGCCTAAGCQTGNTAKACGTGGEACIDCGVGRLCQSAACVLDRTSLWDVYISFAVVPDKDENGAAWDLSNGAPDPYVVVYTSEGTSTHTAETTNKTDSTVPFWAETPLKGIKASELLNNTSIEIWDYDVPPNLDDYMGGCKLPLTPAIFDGSLQDHVCPATATGVEVKVYYRINPHVP